MAGLMAHRCPTCRGHFPGDGEPVCRCGSTWYVDWEQTLHLLLTRSGGRCEARTPACLGDRIRGYSLHRLSRSQVSIHHRRPRRMGGSRLADTHTLANLLLLCGSGTVGCHGAIESQRTTALDRGYLLHQGAEPAQEPLVLPGGHQVLLDPVSPFYVDSSPPTLRLDAPDWA